MIYQVMNKNEECRKRETESKTEKFFLKFMQNLMSKRKEFEILQDTESIEKMESFISGRITGVMGVKM